MLTQISKSGSCGIITLKRPDQRNALSRQTLREIHQGFEDLHQERSVRSVIFTGEGSAFCAGMDLQEMLDTAKSVDPTNQWHQDAIQYKELIELMLLYPKPIIAAVNGPAVAGGAGLVVASDLVVASPTARFGFPEPLRGIVAGLVSPLLAFRVGAGRAANLLLTSRLIEAAEAESLGVYQQIDADVVAAATAIGELVAKGAPEAIQLTKKLINETIGETLSIQLATGAAISATSRTTDSAKEGLEAFIEKREPEWQ